MRNILRQWRITAVCTLLFGSLALFGMEMRSRVMLDVLALSDGAHHQRLIVVMNETISLLRWELANNESGVDTWQSIPSDEFEFVISEIEQLRSRTAFTELHIPFWCLILPLTLLAGGLLFWNPGAKIQ